MTQTQASRKTAPKSAYRIGRRMMLGAFIVLGLVVGCGTWVANAHITGAVIANGQLMVERHLKQVQHRDGGIVGAILVDDGDRVQAGDVLIELVDDDTRTELALLQSELTQSQARLARVSAEFEGTEDIAFPQDLTSDQASQEAMDGEARIFQANRTMRDGQKEQLRLQIEQIGAEADGLNAQLEAKALESEAATENLATMEDLFKQNLVEISRFNSAKQEVARLQGESGSIQSDIARAGQRKSELEMQILGVDLTMRAQAQEEKRTLEAKISEVRERLLRAQDRLSRMVVRAPEDGVVNELAVHTIGGVVTPAQTLLSIVPDSEDLLVDVNFAATDIDQLQLGQPVRLRFPAFNMRTTPEISGTITHLAAAASADRDTGAKWYSGKVRLGPDIEKIGRQKLVPGMPVEVFVTTEERTVLSYLAKPVVDQMVRTFREE